MKTFGLHRQKVRRWIYVICLVAAGGLIIWKIIDYLQRPATATIRRPSSSPADKAAQPETITTLKGKFFELKYGEAFTDLSDTSRQNPGVLEQYQLMSQNPVGNDTLVVGIKKLPQGGMSEDSSYKLRQVQKEVFDPQERHTINKQDVIIVKRKDAQEAVAFTTGKGMMATVSMRSTKAGADAHADLITLMQTFQWLE